MRKAYLVVLCVAGCGIPAVEPQPSEPAPGRQELGAAASPSAKLIGFRGPLDAAAVSRAGGRTVHQWPDIQAVAALLPPQAVAALSANPNVEYIEDDREVNAFAISGSGEETWGNVAVRADQVRAASPSHSGAGITVCVIDTGVDPNHPEFTRTPALFAEGRDFVDNDATPWDGSGCTAGNCAVWGTGHGTHVTGTIAAQLGGTGLNPPNGAGIAGVAPGVTLVEYRVLGLSGSGSTSAVINAITACKARSGPRIASLSLGSKFKSRTEQRAFDDADRAGVLSFAAAGNSGDGSTSYPAGYGSVVSVAAVDASLRRAGFSQTNRDVELAAPGVGVLSTVPRGAAGAALAQVGTTTYPSAAMEFAGSGNVTGPLADCGLCDSASSCGAPAHGFIAFCDRGNITFAAKTLNAVAQGATAVLIANNDSGNPEDPGSFTLGSAGSWPPVVSVSYGSGLAIRTDGAFGTSTQVVVGSSDYASWNGTSMATPHASACAALAWSSDLTLSRAQVRDRLNRTAVDLGARGRDSSFGFGLIDCYRAIFGPF